MSTGNRTYQRKILFSLMMLAFMWVIIGDLVSMHLELIYGLKDMNWHQPYSKPHKSESKTFKVKTHKSDSQSGKHLWVFLTTKFQLLINLKKDSLYQAANCLYISSNEKQTPSLRGPPTA